MSSTMSIYTYSGISPLGHLLPYSISAYQAEHFHSAGIKSPGAILTIICTFRVSAKLILARAGEFSAPQFLCFFTCKRNSHLSFSVHTSQSSGKNVAYISNKYIVYELLLPVSSYLTH